MRYVWDMWYSVERSTIGKYWYLTMPWHLTRHHSSISCRDKKREREHIPISASNRCMWGAYFVTCHVIDPIISKCSRGPSFVAHSWGSTWSLPDHPQKCHCVYFGMFLSKSTLRHAVCNDFKLRSSNGRRFQVRLNLFESLRVQDPYMPKHRTMDNNDSV